MPIELVSTCKTGGDIGIYIVLVRFSILNESYYPGCDGYRENCGNECHDLIGKPYIANETRAIPKR